MRILQHHVDFIEYEPIKKEIDRAEEVEKKKVKLEDLVVIFIAVEEGDDEAIVEAAIDQVMDSLKILKVNKILIYPYAHLSNNLAKPKIALEILEKMAEYANKKKLETYRAPFGWNKQYSFRIKAHPLAEQAKFITKETLKQKTKPKKVEEKPKAKQEEPKELSERDHRILGQKLDLFSFQEVGPGMVFWHPKGMTIRNQLIDFWRKEHIKAGYLEVNTPIILNKELWVQSGHWEHYKNNMFFTEIEGIDFAVKPMNCPGSILIFRNTSRSYRDLPLRFAELGLVNRNELSGVISGLFRMRTFTQDDAHLFVRKDQLEEEIIRVVDLVDHFYKIFGFEYHVELSTRPKDSMGSDEAWEIAEGALEQALQKKKLKFKVNAGDGAFYGPKIDFHIKDSLGRSWQCATVQVDFMMPERFNLSYVGEDGKGHRPVIIHRVIYGSIERFMGILVEHYNGAFPLWLSPIQVRVIPLTDRNNQYGKKVLDELSKNEIRVDSDFVSGTVEKRIRESQLEKIPYVIVVGDKEEKNNAIAVRTQNGRVEYNLKLDDFIKRIMQEIKIRGS